MSDAFTNVEKGASPSFKMAIRYRIYGGRSEEQVLDYLLRILTLLLMHVL